MLFTYRSGSVVIQDHVCEYHKNHPHDTTYAGCTCSTCYTTVPLQSLCEDCEPDKHPNCDKCLGC